MIERLKIGTRGTVRGSKGGILVKTGVELPEVLPVNREDFLKLLLDLIVKK